MLIFSLTAVTEYASLFYVKLIFQSTTVMDLYFCFMSLILSTSQQLCIFHFIKVLISGILVQKVQTFFKDGPQKGIQLGIVQVHKVSSNNSDIRLNKNLGWKVRTYFLAAHGLG